MSQWKINRIDDMMDESNSPSTESMSIREDSSISHRDFDKLFSSAGFIRHRTRNEFKYEMGQEYPRMRMIKK